MDNLEKLILLVFSLAAGITGVVIVITQNWVIALGVFLMLWANNISNRSNK